MTLWGGNFSQELNELAWQFNASISFDQRMAPQDIRGSQAWAKALAKAGLLTQSEYSQISIGLQNIQEEFIVGSFKYEPTDEDIHTAVERRLGELIGSLAGKLHTGRSRNDQVVTDFRLWIMDNMADLLGLLHDFQKAILNKTEEGVKLIMPGYTHLRRAQPVLLAHWWLSHFWALSRDVQRLKSLSETIATMPLGSGALAGTAYNIDRHELAEQLGFKSPSINSLDAISDRDFAAEFLFWAALLGVHISRLAEALILFTSSEFGFFQISDAYSTGSSLMPQKKNPDVFELARAKSAVFTGNLVTLLTLLKGLPSAYDKDLQEDKQPVFITADTLKLLIPALSGAINTLKANPEIMLSAVDDSLSATDMADYLVRKGVPFRQAHHIVAKAVNISGEENIPLHSLSMDTLKSLHPAFEMDVYDIFSPFSSIKFRSSFGGTSPECVLEQISVARGQL